MSIKRLGSYDPWETRTQDEIDGIAWPPPAVLTPDEESELEGIAIKLAGHMMDTKEQILSKSLHLDS